MRIELYRETVTQNGEYNLDALMPGVSAKDILTEEQMQQTKPGDYRWRIWESSDVIGASTEGYEGRSDMIHNLLAVTGGRLRRRRDELFLERRTMQRGRLARFPVEDKTGDDDDA